MPGYIDLSIFEAAFRLLLKYDPESETDKMFKAGPYKYQDFNQRSQNVLNNVVSQINKKYGTFYDPSTAFNIEDDGYPSMIYIGLKDLTTNEEKFFFMFNYGKDGVMSCDDYYNQQKAYELSKQFSSPFNH